jgi:N-acetylneuraminic acid mutarotase
MFKYQPKHFVLYIIAFMLLGCNDPAQSPYPLLSFVKKKSMPGTGRASAVAFVINDKGYVALGRTAVRSAQLNDCWQYDPVNDTWTQKASFPGIARVKAMAAVANGKAYVGLGFDPTYAVYSNQSAYLTDLWMYDPNNDTWIQKAKFPGTETDACVSFTIGNEIYVGSGFDGHGFGSEFWKYNPDNDTWTRIVNFPGANRFGATLCSNGAQVYFGTGYNTYNQSDWWEYLPASNSWKQRRSMPDNGRENAVSLSINNRFFVGTGRHFAGNLTGGGVKSDMLEYDILRDVWYERGSIPQSGRENAVAFTINGKGYIGFGENDTDILNDFWCFEP